MSTGLPVAELVRLASALATGGRSTPPGAKTRGVVALAAGTLAVTAVSAAIVCLFVAAWIAVRRFAGPIGTPLVIAGGLMIVALVGFAVLRWSRRPESRPTLPPMPVDAILEEVARLVVAHKGPILTAALLAGLIAAGSGKGR